MFSKFFRDEKGASALEYAMIAGVLALGIVAATTTMGNSINDFFNRAQTDLVDVGTANTNPETEDVAS